MPTQSEGGILPSRRILPHPGDVGQFWSVSVLQYIDSPNMVPSIIWDMSELWSSTPIIHFVMIV